MNYQDDRKLEIEEEYDPSKPNDYLKIISEESIIRNKERGVQNKNNGSNINKKLTGEQKAWRMLEKMGWKGQGIYILNKHKGLGKYEQGITIPLISRRTSKKHGVIINFN